MKRIFYSLAATILAGSAFSATFVIPGTYSSSEGDGSSTTSGLFGSAAATVQIQITASELANLGLNPGDQITGVRTRLNGAQPTSPAADITIPSLDITLGQAAFPIAALTAVYANNIKNQAVVRSGTFKIPANSMPGGAAPNAFGVLVPFSTPYTYAGGDLVFMYSKSAVTNAFLADAANNYAGVGTAYRNVVGAGYQAAMGNLGTGLPLLEFEMTPKFANKNSASYVETTLTPEMIAYGETAGIASALTVAPDGPWPPSLGGAHLDLADSAGQVRPAPLYYVTQNAMSYLVPSGTAMGRATATLTTSSGLTVAGSVNIVPVAPGIYAANATGSGVAAGLFLRFSNGNETYGYLFDPNTRNPVPIDLGSGSDQVFLQLYGTGFRAAKQATATVGGTGMPVQGFAAVTAYQGEDVINIGPLPATLAGRGIVDVIIIFDGKTANTVTVEFK